MLKDYLPILLQVIVAIGFVASALILSVVLGKAARRNATKDTPYECGMLPDTSSPRFSVKFYLVAMLFILFDIEVVFMYPLGRRLPGLCLQRHPADFSSSGPPSSGACSGFAFILTVGYVYAIMKGALDWKR